MEYPTKLATYYSVLYGRFPVEIWEYNNCLELVSRTAPEHELELYMLRYSHAFSVLRDCLAHARTLRPLLLSDRYGLAWLACFSRPDHIPQHLYVLGPLFLNDFARERLIAHISHRDHPADMRSALLRVLERLPVIPMNELLDIGSMIHYCLNKAQLPPSEVVLAPDPRPCPISDLDHMAPAHDLGLSSVLYERICDNLRDGNTLDPVLSAALSDLTAYGSVQEELLSRAVPATIILADRLCQAALSAGLPAALGRELRDRFAAQAMDTRDAASLSALRTSMYAAFAQNVQRYRPDSSISRPIRLSCDYIRMHITEPLSLEQLSALSGYTEYYYSRKFKREVGLSPAEFINQARILHAKLLLKDTDMSIQDISKKLNFSSRSYFTSVFQSIAGISPSAYRRSIQTA